MILDVRLSLFVSRAVGFFNDHKAARLIEPSRAVVALERPQAQVPMATPRNVEQTVSDPVALSARTHVELIYPAFPESDEPKQPLALPRSPDLALIEDGADEIGPIFVGGVKACEPRQLFVEGQTMNRGGLRHVAAVKLPDVEGHMRI